MKRFFLLVFLLFCWGHAQTLGSSVIDNAFKKLEAVPFYHMNSEGTDYNGVEIGSSINYLAPDKYHIWYDDGTQIIFIGNDYYFYPDPETGGWGSQTLESSDSGIEILDDGIISDVQSLGVKEFGGKPCNTYSFLLRTSDGIEEDTLCLDSVTGLPVWMTVTGEVADLVFEFFYDKVYNQPDDFNPPITEEIP